MRIKHFTRKIWSAGPWFAVLFSLTSQAAIRDILVTNDFTLEKDSRVEARLLVRGSHLTIDGNGAMLAGAGQVGKIDSFAGSGAGVELQGCVNVTVKNLKVSGFMLGLAAIDCQALSITGCDFSDNYHNPAHGWGELPPAGGIRFERVRSSVVRANHANRVWNGIELVDSDDNQVADNDFSHCSNVCGKLWHASRNRFLSNNFSYGIRIDRAAGEVHARDSTGVLIETGSDDNYWYANDVTYGGDGIFVRVLNGWVSKGNLFVENDTSYANNNCIESWSPGNTYIRNRANHGSYGFWLGGSDHTVLVGNEAGWNGQTNGSHNAPEPGFEHGGIVLVSGSSSHTLINGNYCHDNNGGGIVFRGDTGSQGARWRTFHWVVQQNRLERNRWGIWGRWADWIFLAQNREMDNRETDSLKNVTNLFEMHAADPTIRPPTARLRVSLAPTAQAKAQAVAPGVEPHVFRAAVGCPVRFDAETSSDPQGRPLEFRWDLGDGTFTQATMEHVFAHPGFYRVGLTVENGLLADLAFCDLLVVDDSPDEIGTEGQATGWGFELEDNADGRGKMQFSTDANAVVGKSSITFIPNPYPGAYATAIYPATRDARWDLVDKTRLHVWLKARNPNLPGFQNPGPVIYLYGSRGYIKYTPREGRNLFADSPYSEARWEWLRVEVPFSGGEGWVKETSGECALNDIGAFGISLDSWGYAPFQVWVDGLAFEAGEPPK